MKKKVLFVLILILTIAIAIVSVGCSKKSYGTPFDNIDDLRAALVGSDINLRYPEYLGEREEKDVFNYVGNRDIKNNQYTGYKIYNFGSPFFVLVTGYNHESDSVMSEDLSKITKMENLMSSIGEIEFYQGMAHKDSLYLIGIINIDGKHYECRVTANKQMEDGEMINAIYPDNDKYPLAKNVLVSVMESIK